MIVPGEKPEDSDPEEEIPIASEATEDLQSGHPAGVRASNASSLSFFQIAPSVSTFTESFSKHLKAFSFGPFAGDHQERLEAKSLLHEKLFETNTSLKRNMDRLMDEKMYKAPKDLSVVSEDAQQMLVSLQDAHTSIKMAEANVEEIIIQLNHGLKNVKKMSESC